MVVHEWLHRRPDYRQGKGKACHNVLYFVADDMRSDWGVFGLQTKTPNLDKLAAKVRKPPLSWPRSWGSF